MVKKPTLFITGAGGFLGRALLARLDPARFDTVYCLTRRREQVIFPEPKPQNFQIVPGDLLNPDDYRQALEKTDTVIHLAAVTGKAAPEEYTRGNAYATMLLLDRCKSAHVRQFLFVSSIAVSFEDKYRYFYALSKEQGEMYVRDSGLNYCILRPTMIMGQGSPVFGGMARLAGLPVIPVFGNGKTRIQPIHVEDVAKALRYIEENGLFHGETVELGGPKELTVTEFLETVAVMSRGKTAKMVHLPIGAAVFFLSLLERVAYRFMPLTVGQLATFRNNGAARDNEIFKKLSPLMRGLEAQIRESMPVEPRRAVSPEIRRECAVLCRYLAGVRPGGYILDKYDVCHEKINLTPMDFHDRFLVKLANIHPLFTRTADVYSRFFRPASAVRKRLAYLMAILEVTPPYFRYYDAAPCGKAGLIISFGFRGVSMILHLIPSLLLLFPLQILARFFSGRPSVREPQS